MIITLQKDHESPEGHFKAGETIEVDEQTYDFLQSVYDADKASLMEQLKELKPRKTKK